ncbi:transcription termination factor 2 [Thrips palmi]|uniref:Transcription termination factor 2 n=1 Tax=Thrips palmi TaxID=161013 RepID=A0A6P8ZX17_THRPL|nr:transcription termination factor 2 [Thrips palmi]
MDLSASSTPLQKARRRAQILDSDSDDERLDQANGLVIPPSDPEDDDRASLINSSNSSDSLVMTTPVQSRSMPKQNNLLRRSLGYKSAVGDNLEDSSQYMSFHSAATFTPEKGNSGLESSHHESDVSNKSLDVSAISEEHSSSESGNEIESFQSRQNSHQNEDEIESFQSEHSSIPLNDSDFGFKNNDCDDDSQSDDLNNSENVASTSHQPENIEDSESAQSDEFDDGAAHSNDDSRKIESNEDMYMKGVAQSSKHGIDTSYKPVLIQDGDASNSSIYYDDSNMAKNLNSSDVATSLDDKVKEAEFFGSPKRSSLIDLTQSDSSLQNSPVGATRQHDLKQREIGDIVADLSSVSNDIMVKEALLDSINNNTLPDNGRNLKMMVYKLKLQKQALEKELSEHKETAAQQATIEQMQTNLERKLLSSKQSTLNFQPSVKIEQREYESIDSEEDGSPRSLNSHDSISKPEWGDLPNPDMTISGFGKKAMQTHLAEKSLTLEALSSLHNALKTCPDEDTYAEDPKYLRVELMPHQKHGLAWMLWREQEKPSGGILADDMGLGKTLSMISLILKDLENKEKSDDDSESDDESPRWMSSKYSRMVKGGTLVVCPASLVAQWEQEIYRRVKKRALSVELYHGPKRESKPRRLAKHDVVVTTYNLVSRESGVDSAKNATKIKDKGPLFMVKWERIILDEAHMVRNHKSQMALGVCELMGKHRWCLTGTPVQNKQLDLYALLKFLQCSPFDDLVVWKRWVDNKNAAGMQRLNTMMKSLMLRRTKEQLQEKGDLNCLPEKSSEQIDVHLDPEELELYEKVALFSSTLFAEFLVQRAEKQQLLDARYGMSTRPVWEQEGRPDNQFTTTKELANMHRKMKGITEIKTHMILVLLLRLRQICCHPGLVKKMVENGDIDFNVASAGVEDEDGLDVDLFNQMNNLNIDESAVESEENDDPLNKSGIFSADSPVLSFDRPSAKIRAILDLLEEKLLDSDDKAIIVSQWSSVLNIIAKFLKQMQFKFETLSGEVPVHKRQDIVNDINRKGSGAQILLLSLTAGGVGLNLVGANHLLMVDNHWNPQLEAQACDRIYRVGQKKHVFVYKFITVNTIEEKIVSVQAQKLALAHSVLTGTRDMQASKLTLADLQMLFSAPNPAPAPAPAPAPQ